MIATQIKIWEVLLVNSISYGQYYFDIEILRILQNHIVYKHIQLGIHLLTKSIF